MITPAAREKFIKWDEVKLFVDTYTKSWAMIVTWFNWFFGINVAAMTYIVVSDKGIIKNLALPLCVFMSVCVCVGIVVSVVMVSYCRNCARHVEKVKADIYAESGYIFDDKLAIANPVLGLASWLICISLTWTLGAWIYIALWTLQALPAALL